MLMLVMAWCDRVYSIPCILGPLNIIAELENEYMFVIIWFRVKSTSSRKQGKVGRALATRIFI
jgi:hypothetical protein